jgi:hypothetical protein
MEVLNIVSIEYMVSFQTIIRITTEITIRVTVPIEETIGANEDKFYGVEQIV